MARMLPNRISPEVTSSAERRVYDWFRDDPATEDWIVLHSLGLARHERLLFGEIDFVVLAPSYGIFCLEVKGGRVARENGLWVFTNRYGESNKKVRGPFDQAREGMFSLMQEIRTRLGREDRYSTLLYGYGTVFPDVDFDVEGPDYDRNQIWDRTLCRTQPISQFIVNLSHYVQTNQTRVYGEEKRRTLPSCQLVRAIADSLRGDFDRPMLLSATIDEVGSNLVKLTKEQFRGLDMFEDNKRVVVEGPAGTGKTILAVESVRRSIEHNEKVAFFCYNAPLAAWAKKQFQGRLPEDCFVGTLHSFMLGRSIYKSTTPEHNDEFFTHTLPRAFVDNYYPQVSHFDRIIVDEAQDIITDEYLAVLDCILNGGLDRGRWVLFGDFAHQAIYQSGRSEEDILSLLDAYAGFAKIRLTYNCRNTRNIGVQAKMLSGLDSRFYDDAIAGPPVTYQLWHNQDEERSLLRSTLVKLANEGVALNDIVILTPLAVADSIACSHNTPVDINQSIGFGGTQISSIARFKGLESDVIIVVDCTSYTNIGIFYVGITRAKTKLIILESESARMQRAALIKEHLNVS